MHKLRERKLTQGFFNSISDKLPYFQFVKRLLHFFLTHYNRSAKRTLTKADVQVKTSFLQLQGEEVPLNPLTVQQQTILLQGLEVYGDMVVQRVGPLSWERVHHCIISIVL